MNACPNCGAAEKLDRLIESIEHVMSTIDGDPATYEMLQDAVSAAKGET